MPVAITLLKPSFLVGVVNRPVGGNLMLKPLGIVVGPLRYPMADVKRDAGKAVSALFAGLRASLPTLAR